MRDIREFQVEGIQFIIGRLKGETTTTVQSVLFDRSLWDPSDARTWLGDRDFKSTKLDETEDKLRFRQRNPGDFKDDSFRTISAGSRSQVQTFGEHGVKLRVGHLKGDDLLSIQAILFSKAAWSVVDAFQWLKDRHFFGSRFDDTNDFWAFEISSPESFDDTSMKEISEHETSFTELVEGYTSHLAKRKKKGFRGDSDLFEIKGVEIFGVGVWNKDKYTRKDLDDMVKAFDKVGFPVPIKLGHDSKSGGLAFGWIKTLYRIGDKLVADFMDIPKQLFDLIKKRRFDTVSSEIFWNLERNGKTFRRVLKAVALLGSETPGVSNLAPLRDVVLTTPDSGFDRVLSYSHHPEEWNMDKIEELTTKVGDLQKDLEEAEEARKTAESQADEAKDKGGKDAEEAATKLVEAEEAAKKLSEELAEAKDALDGEAKSNAAEVKQLGTKVEKLQKRLDENEEEKRQELIKKGAEDCKLTVIRPHIKALYDITTVIEKTVKFTEGDKEVELSAKDIVDSLVDELNKYVAKLFKEFGMVEELEHPATDYIDASAEAHERATKYMADHKMDDTPDNLIKATEAVLSKDPQLKAAYAGSSSSVN